MRTKLHRKVCERIKESKWGTSCKYMWITVIGDGSIHLGRNITFECLLSHAVFCEVLNDVIDDVFQIKCLFNGEMFHSAFKKNIHWKCCVIGSESLDIDYCQAASSGMKKFFVRFYHQTSFWSAWNISYKNNCAHLKMKDKFHSATQFGYDLWKSILQGAWFFSSRRYTKIFWALKLPLCGLVV